MSLYVYVHKEENIKSCFWCHCLLCWGSSILLYECAVKPPLVALLGYVDCVTSLLSEWKVTLSIIQFDLME